MECDWRKSEYAAGTKKQVRKCMHSVTILARFMLDFQFVNALFLYCLTGEADK
jgi:hypothetical protein